MNNPTSAPAAPADYVGLGEAAQQLALSRTSVQKLVDLGHLAAVRTAGGHRRILRSSLLAYREQMVQGPGHGRMGAAAAREVRRAAGQPQPFHVLLVDDDEVHLRFLSTLVQRYFPAAICTVTRDAMEAVVQIERQRPNVVITDLAMQPFDGFRLVRLIHVRPEYAGISVLAMSALSDREIARRGGIPDDVPLYRKPLNAERLLGYLEGHVQAHRKAWAA